MKTAIQLFCIILVNTCAVSCVQPQMLSLPSQEPKPSPSQAISQACEAIVHQLCQKIPSNEVYRLVVRPFDDHGGTGSIARRALTEHLKGDLSGSGHFTVVEDTRMNAILSEAAIQEDLKGLLQTNTVIDLEHSLIGIDAILVGTFIDYGPEWGIECRLVPMRCGTIAGHASSVIPKAAFVTVAPPRDRTDQDTRNTPIRRNDYVRRSYETPPHQYNGSSSVYVTPAPSVQQLESLIPR